MYLVVLFMGQGQLLRYLDANAFIDFFLVHLYISKKKGIKNKNS